MIPEIPKRKLNITKLISDIIKIAFGLATAGFFISHTDLKHKSLHYENDFMEVTIVFRLNGNSSD